MRCKGLDMSMTFTCSHCHNEFIKITPDEEVVYRFKKWYPQCDLRSAKIVCESCYDVAMRVLQLEMQRRSWLNYATSS